MKCFVDRNVVISLCVYRGHFDLANTDWLINYTSAYARMLRDWRLYTQIEQNYTKTHTHIDDISTQLYYPAELAEWKQTEPIIHEDAL